MFVSKTHMAAVFDEWLRRYTENPDAFDDWFDENGEPAAEYGKRCAEYFQEVADDLSNARRPAAP